MNNGLIANYYQIKTLLEDKVLRSRVKNEQIYFTDILVKQYLKKTESNHFHVEQTTNQIINTHKFNLHSDPKITTSNYFVYHEIINTSFLSEDKNIIISHQDNVYLNIQYLLKNNIEYLHIEEKRYIDLPIIKKILYVLEMDTAWIDTRNLKNLFNIQDKNSFSNIFITKEKLDRSLGGFIDELEHIKQEKLSISKLISFLKFIKLNIVNSDDCYFNNYLAEITTIEDENLEFDYRTWIWILKMISKQYILDFKKNISTIITSDLWFLYLANNNIYLDTKITIDEKNNNLSNNIFNNYKKKYQAILKIAHTIPQVIDNTGQYTRQEKNHEIPAIREHEKISWIKTIKSYAKCSNFGYLELNISSKIVQKNISLGLSPILNGILIHNFLEEEVQDLDNFLTKWQDKFKHSLNPFELTLWKKKLAILKNRWDEFKKIYSWLDYPSTRELVIDFHYSGYSGKLKIDLIVHHPLGDIILDFKTGEASLNILKKHPRLDPQLPLYTMAYSKPIIAIGYIIIDGNNFKPLVLSNIELNNLKKTHEEDEWKKMLSEWKEDVDLIIEKIKSCDNTKKPFEPYYSCDECKLIDICKI